MFRVREEDTLPTLIFWVQEEAGQRRSEQGVEAVVGIGNYSLPAYERLIQA